LNSAAAVSVEAATATGVWNANTCAAQICRQDPGQPHGAEENALERGQPRLVRQPHPRPPGEKDRAETRDGALDDVLVEAIETIRAAVASAAGGDDPFVLNDSTITISFAVTAEGTISIGVDEASATS
jgi:hypothetical protein